MVTYNTEGAGKVANPCSTLTVSLGGSPDLRTSLALILVIHKREDTAILCQEAEGTQDFKQITQTS